MMVIIFVHIVLKILLDNIFNVNKFEYSRFFIREQTNYTISHNERKDGTSFSIVRCNSCNKFMASKEFGRWRNVINGPRFAHCPHCKTALFNN